MLPIRRSSHIQTLAQIRAKINIQPDKVSQLMATYKLSYAWKA